MTRGTYRLENEPPTGVVTVPFYGIRLDLTQVDNPTYRASNVPSAILVEQGVTLTLPTSEAGGATLDAG